jgi:hypothetical protein
MFLASSRSPNPGDFKVKDFKKSKDGYKSCRILISNMGRKPCLTPGGMN